MKNANFIYSLVIDPLGLAKQAQVGVDLTAKAIFRLETSGYGDGGAVFADKTAAIIGKGNVLAARTAVSRIPYKHGDAPEPVGWQLEPGVYAIAFDQGLHPLGATNTALIWQRSSLGRNGVEIRSSVFDPGFGTPEMGAMLFVSAPIFIEEHARVAQILVFDNDEAALYDGQWAGSKDVK